MSKRYIKNSGFTLLEILIALVMLALAFTASYMGISVVTRNLTRLYDKTAADWVASNVIAEAQIGLMQVPAEGDISGIAPMMVSDWRWFLHVDRTENDAVIKITVSVKKIDGGDDVVTESSFLY